MVSREKISDGFWPILVIIASVIGRKDMNRNLVMWRLVENGESIIGSGFERERKWRSESPAPVAGLLDAV